ncbi:DUF4129 domain-containing protein [Oceanihabitans sediminis]|uniref:DUF4129 domain-containing protein n=2 Tax=Oceanihabitans sediminis TaxID=1812012 RepID=A0A368P574_9FLAO|nr:DUF4129 domain-containing protein [Oceanihabitans sediminis]MDX1277411.1 DUF4129 domain-containing protein [Oceanihabitans sediminis]RCU56939.1 DUF4129 domain-containing protein [Oceanihabitans sediminis]
MTPIKVDDSNIEVKEISKEDLKDYYKDSSFDYTETIKNDNFFAKIKVWLRNILIKIFEWIFGTGAAEGIVKFIFNTLPYLLLAVLVFLLIKLFLKVETKNLIGGKKKTASIRFTEEEHIIKNEDINALIAQAIEKQEYRIAIRYYYLLALKTLSDKEIISWKQQKTNEDYISEIKEQSLKSNFIKITKIYDYVWYGEFNIDAIKFENLKTAFETLNKNLAD